MLERNFQARLISELNEMLPGCVILKNDPNYIQGFPDILILYKNKWAALECKKNANSRKQPNQKHYVELMDRMSFSRFIYPENREEVLRELQQTFKF
jgi:hypothetical protein